MWYKDGIIKFQVVLILFWLLHSVIPFFQFKLRSLEMEYVVPFIYLQSSSNDVIQSRAANLSRVIFHVDYFGGLIVLYDTLAVIWCGTN